MTQFYSYLWLREDGTPWYAGKGSGKRAYVQHGDFYPPKDKALILVMPRNNEEEAFRTEIELIANWGRKDIGTGCLHNHTAGGENPPKGSFKGQKWSEEQRRKMRLAKFGKPNLKARGLKRSAETIKRMSKPRSHSWVLSEDTKKAQSAAAVIREAKKKEQGIHCGQVFGYQHTDEAKKKMSAAKKGKPGHALTKEHIAAMAEGRRGKKRGPYHKRENL
jgi:hypothetical protein